MRVFKNEYKLLIISLIKKIVRLYKEDDELKAWIIIFKGTS